MIGYKLLHAVPPSAHLSPGPSYCRTTLSKHTYTWAGHTCHNPELFLSLVFLRLAQTSFDFVPYWTLASKELRGE